MNSRTSHFSRSPQARQRRATKHIGGYAAHVIVLSWCNRDQVFYRVNACMQASCVDSWKLLREFGANLLSRIQERTSARNNFRKNRARHHVTRRQLCIPVDRQHEAFAFTIDQNSAVSAQRFGCKWRGVLADIDSCGMELHEFRIGNYGTGTGGNSKAETAALKRVGRHCVELANSACGENDGSSVVAPALTPLVIHDHTHHAAFFSDKTLRGYTGYDLD